MQYRALYTFNPDDSSPGGEAFLTKIHGTGPRQIASKMMEKFFKFVSFFDHFTDRYQTVKYLNKLNR